MRTLRSKLVSTAFLIAITLGALGVPALVAQTTTGLTGTVSLNVNLNQVAALDFGSTTFVVDKRWATTYTTGAAAGAINRLFTDTRTLAASGTEDLDAAGVLVDAAGQTLTFARLKVICIAASSANTNNVQVTRPASNGVPIFMAASDGIAVTPGSRICLDFPTATGIPVTAGTGDLITITNSAGSTSVTYEVLLAGSAT
jgi:hypothetical protein